jgi:hypothetical protein
MHGATDSTVWWHVPCKVLTCFNDMHACMCVCMHLRAAVMLLSVLSLQDSMHMSRYTLVCDMLRNGALCSVAAVTLPLDVTPLTSISCCTVASIGT